MRSTPRNRSCFRVKLVSLFGELKFRPGHQQRLAVAESKTMIQLWRTPDPEKKIEFICPVWGNIPVSKHFKPMKMIKNLIAIALSVSVLAAPLAVFGADTNAPAKSDKKLIPDKMTACPVSGDKLGGDMGKPFVMEYKGQEVKLCCKSCKKDFDKDPAKFMKKIREADKKAPADKDAKN